MVVLITGAGGGLGPTVVRTFENSGATVIAATRKSADLTDPVQVKRLIDSIERIDALVHLAGGFAGGAVHETDDETWTRMMDMNLRSAFHVFRAVIPHMRKAGRGRIVAIGSRAAVDLTPGIAAYAAAKAGLASLVRSISLENKDLGITANAILPSTIGVSVQPQTIANLALYLVSDAAAEITGVSIPC
jgi:NAD(P)-dependent dehydrogenase (short-subunit alcohol dehydrogenase family)